MLTFYHTIYQYIEFLTKPIEEVSDTLHSIYHEFTTGFQVIKYQEMVLYVAQKVYLPFQQTL